MCHSCVSRNPGNMDFFYFLDSRLRGNETLQPTSLRSGAASPAAGKASWFIRLKCYHFSIPPQMQVLWNANALDIFLHVAG